MFLFHMIYEESCEEREKEDWRRERSISNEKEETSSRRNEEK